MDPQANLKEQLELANDIHSIMDNDNTLGEEAYHVAMQAERLAELVLALDRWRRKGGFDPYVNILTCLPSTNS